MIYLKYFESGAPADDYPGPSIINQSSEYSTPSLSNALSAGGSDGYIGAEFGKNIGPSAKPFPDKYKQNIKNPKTKESQKRLDAIKKLQSLRPSKMLDFDQDIKPKKTLKRFDEFEKDSQ